MILVVGLSSFKDDCTSIDRFHPKVGDAGVMPRFADIDHVYANNLYPDVRFWRCSGISKSSM